MNIIEQPVFLISALILIAVFFLGAGIYVAFLAQKSVTVKVADISDFTSPSAVKRLFQKQEKKGIIRNIVYISAKTQRIKTLYDDKIDRKLRKKAEAVIFEKFSTEKNALVCSYDEDSYVAINNFEKQMLIENTGSCFDEIREFMTGSNIDHMPDLYFGCYIGVASDIGFDEAVKRAKQAAYRAQKEQKPFAVWDYDAYRLAELEEYLEKNIWKQIKEDNFFIEVQPVVDVRTGKVVSGEALSRLNSQTDGILSPALFLPAINQMGVGEEFDYHIFDKVCMWLSSKEVNFGDGFRSISCNFSKRTLCTADFASKICEIVDKYSLPYSSLAIEVLEGDLMDRTGMDQIISNIKLLKDKGITILLDDYGSVHTSLADMQNYPVDVVKIDREIIVNTDTEKGMSIFHNIVALAKELGADIICEGVETQSQSDIVKNAGCTMIQGYLYYRPMTPQQFEDLMKNNA